MKRRKLKRKQASGAPKWMVTYSDMVTLILVFFILLFAMSQIDLVKFEAITDSFQNRMILDFYPSAMPTENTSHVENGKLLNNFEPSTLLKDMNDRDDKAGKQEDSLSLLMHDVETYLDENDLNNMITASRTERGVVLVLQEKILFDSGEASILASGKPFLNEISRLLKDIPNNVKVEGHTDNRPISNYRYPSNWELSGARASSVIRYLIDENSIDGARFSSAGYAETKPIVDNNSSKNWSKNRRVEIVILEKNAEEKEGADR
ncbi:chemotaxis protein MotB [Virgibacillus halotolerans]|uniref:flagellar motor protein MotS n=1 Tax=Virgibacillus halotolerans TaxID=1071053 RepID=UPI001960F429|nr:flagellar motor protein MotS [Virgibacillus halotolerans]MBM7597669.1 chemotaxis protein MotB [Virgibacillus halotolerans]